MFASHFDRISRGASGIVFSSSSCVSLPWLVSVAPDDEFCVEWGKEYADRLKNVGGEQYKKKQLLCACTRTAVRSLTFLLDGPGSRFLLIWTVNGIAHYIEPTRHFHDTIFHVTSQIIHSIGTLGQRRCLLTFPR